MSAHTELTWKTSERPTKYRQILIDVTVDTRTILSNEFDCLSDVYRLVSVTPDMK